MLYVYVITESGAYTLTTSTKLQNKYRLTLYQHEIKEKTIAYFIPSDLSDLGSFPIPGT